MVRSILDYASAIWSPYTQKNIQTLESVQRRSARFVFNDYSPYNSVSNMLTNLGWSPLADRRNEHRLIMLFKIIHHIVDINADVLLPACPCTHSTCGHSKRFLQLPARTNAYSNSFLPSSIKLWNSLRDDVVIVSDLNHFKQGITGLLS